MHYWNYNMLHRKSRCMNCHRLCRRIQCTNWRNRSCNTDDIADYSYCNSLWQCQYMIPYTLMNNHLHNSRCNYQYILLSNHLCTNLCNYCRSLPYMMRSRYRCNSCKRQSNFRRMLHYTN